MNDGKAIIGVYIQNIKCARNGTCQKGKNPFDQFSLKDGRKLSSIVTCYDPNAINPYRSIANNLETWIEEAIASL